jgi:hypothetical protein
VTGVRDGERTEGVAGDKAGEQAIVQNAGLRERGTRLRAGTGRKMGLSYVGLCGKFPSSGVRGVCPSFPKDRDADTCLPKRQLFVSCGAVHVTWLGFRPGPVGGRKNQERGQPSNGPWWRRGTGLGGLDHAGKRPSPATPCGTARKRDRSPLTYDAP